MKFLRSVPAACNSLCDSFDEFFSSSNNVGIIGCERQERVCHSFGWRKGEADGCKSLFLLHYSFTNAILDQTG